MGTITIGRRRSGAAWAAGGGTGAPPCHRRGPGRRRPAQLLARTGAARRRHPTAGAGRAAGATLLCHRRAGVGGRPGPRRPAPSLPPSILRPAQWLCRPCPPPAAWRGPGRRLLDTKYSVAGKLLFCGIITGIRSEKLMWTVGSCCIEWLGIMF